MRIMGLVGLCLCILLARPAGAQSFVVGDLYILSNSLFTGGKGIVRVDPLTGASTLLTAYSSTAKSTFTYDAYRHRLVYADSRSIGGIVGVDAAGNSVDLAPTVATPQLLASRGDGILYFMPTVAPYTLRYLDASGVAHDVLDAAGAGPFQLSSGNFFDEMIYEPGTNSVLLLTGTFNGVPPPCVTSGRTCAVKVPLTGAGTQVAGSLQFTDVDVSPASEIVVGSGLAPGGVLVVLDTNENSSEPRLQLLDPVGMSMSVFASTGSPTYPAAGTAAGTYSSPRSQAVVLDYLGSCLRGFSLGASGDGTRFAENLSGFLSRMIEIRAAGAVSVGDAISRPSLLRLDPVTPNPIARTALVRFALPARGPVRVTIHDLSGRLVRLLLEETSEAGPRFLVWDGRDNQGHLVPSGPYFLRLDASGESVGRKMMILR